MSKLIPEGRPILSVKSPLKVEVERNLRDKYRDQFLPPTDKLVGMGDADYLASYGEVRRIDTYNGPDGA